MTKNIKIDIILIKKGVVMQVAYKLNVDDLNGHKEKQLYINISSVDEEDETSYLLSNPANASCLLNAINNIENHKEKLLLFTQKDL